MSWSTSVHREVINLKIEQAKLEIEALTKIERLQLIERRLEEKIDTTPKSDKRKDDVDTSSGYDSFEDTYYDRIDRNFKIGISTHQEDRDGNTIFTGDRVELLTSSKNNPTFAKGSSNIEVEGTEKEYIKCRLIGEPTKKTKRIGRNLKVVENFNSPSFVKKDE